MGEKNKVKGEGEERSEFLFVSVAFPSSLPTTDAKYSIWGKHMMICQGYCSKVYLMLTLPSFCGCTYQSNLELIESF